MAKSSVFSKGKIFIPDLEEFDSVDSEITSDFLGI